MEDNPLERAIAAQQAMIAEHGESIRILHAQLAATSEQQAAASQRQGEILRQLANQQEVLLGLAQSIREITVAVSNPGAPAPLPSPPPQTTTASVREPKLQLPLRYGGEFGLCRGFLSQCLIFFKSQPSRFTTEESRVAFILSLLTGAALAWADPLIRAQSPIMDNSQVLMKEMALIFDHDLSGKEAATRLTKMVQGRQSVAEFSISFRALAAGTGWADEPLMTLFTNALSDPVKDALATIEPPKTLNELVALAIRIDNRVREREREKGEKKVHSTNSRESFPTKLAETVAAGGEEPMQLGSSSVSCPERKKSNKVICFYCKQAGHVIRQCRKRAAKEKSPL